MKQLARNILLVAVLIATSLVLFVPSAEAVPSYTRRYGFDCSSCHTVWGALNNAGLTFRLSGYRAMFGKDLVPIEEGKDIDIPGTNVKIPGSLPFSVIAGVGYDFRTEKRQAFDGTTNTRGASSIALENVSLYLSSPIGNSLSVFFEFPMYETMAWMNRPTGPSEANDNFGGVNPIRHFQFDTEKGVLEIGKVAWNNLLGSTLPRDSLNALVGLARLPLPYDPHELRNGISPFLVYERRALDLISPFKPAVTLGDMANDYLFRLTEPQLLAELNGMLVPGGPVTASASKETLWFEYHLGVTNGSNGSADNNRSKDVYGRFVGRWYGQSFGFFGYRSLDTYDDSLRMMPSFVIVGAPNTGIFNPTAPFSRNSLSRWGVDGTLSLAPWGIPLSLDNQFMWNRESNPTGFNTEFTWRGGLHQLNWFATPQVVVYGRYDWIRSTSFNDVPQGGVTFSDPREWDAVAGVQYLPYQNVKLIGEYRHRVFEDRATGAVADSPFGAGSQPFPVRGNTARFTDDGFTTRLVVGF